MKILHIITSMDPKRGGVSQAVRNIVLNNFFCDHEVVCMDDNDADYGVADEFIIHKIGNGKTSFQYNPRFKSWLKDNLENYSHAVVHGIWQYHNVATYKAIKSIRKDKRPRIAIMPHGMLDPYFQKAKGRKIKALRNALIWLFTEKKALNAADAMLFTCEEEMLLARQTFSGYHPKNELNVGLGVMQPPAEQDSMHLAFRQKTSVEGPYWLFLSRIHPKKGIRLLIEAYMQLHNENNTIPRLVIAGPLDDDYALEIKALAASNSDIVFTGMISGDTKWGAFYGCEAFLLPSFQENFGIAIVEAMACSRPVVITKNINIWREIITGKGGYLIENQTVLAINNALQMLRQLSPQQIAQAGDRAEQTYRENFNLEKCAKRFVEKLNEL